MERIESGGVTDELWQRVTPLIPTRWAAAKIDMRRPEADWPPKPDRRMFEANVYILRTGCL